MFVTYGETTQLLPGAMARPVLNSCCFRGSLRAGTITAGALGIILSLITLIFIFSTKVKMKTFILQDLDPLLVKIILAINLAMTILISVLLIVGAVKRNRFFMLPWLILAITTAIGLIISTIYSAVYLFIDKQNIEGSVILIIGLITAGVTFYLWFVVLSFYQVIYDEKSRGPYQRPPYQYNYSKS